MSRVAQLCHGYVTCKLPPKVISLATRRHEQTFSIKSRYRDILQPEGQFTVASAAAQLE